ncbi:hypothetical protein ACWF94_12230 [Streptomyces sp. NPDC055078]
MSKTVPSSAPEVDDLTASSLPPAAVALVRQILTDALTNPDTRPSDMGFVRILAGRIGELQQTIRTALTVIDQLGIPVVQQTTQTSVAQQSTQAVVTEAGESR